MTQEQIDRILNLIAQASERLGFEAVRIWPQMVAITFVQNLCWLILGPSLCVTAWVVFSRFVRQYLTAKAELDSRRRTTDRYISSDLDGYEVGLPVAGAMVMIATVVLVVCWPGMLTAVLYPEATTVLKLVGK